MKVEGKRRKRGMEYGGRGWGERCVGGGGWRGREGVEGGG